MRYGPCHCRRAIRGGPALRSEMCKRLATQPDRSCDACRAGCEELKLESALGPIYLKHVGWPNESDVLGSAVVIEPSPSGPDPQERP